MKRSIIFLFMIFCLFIVNKNFIKAADWTALGTTGFSTEIPEFISIAFDGNNVPYVVYRNASDEKVTVMKFDGIEWVVVGVEGFSAGNTMYSKIAIDGNNVPYVVYQDEANNNKATVKKFDGNNWVTVGVEGFTSGRALLTDIAIDENNIPYIVYNDYDNDSKATVMRFEGNTWEFVGNPGFSNGGAQPIDIQFDGNNIPYVAYPDAINLTKATVMKLNGNTWELVGIGGFSVGSINFASLAFDSENTPYMAYNDNDYSRKIVVKKYDGNNWINVGNAGFSAGRADDISLVIDQNNTPFVSYRDHANTFKASVMKFDGNNWVNVGEPGFSGARADETIIIIDNNNIPHIAYRDWANDYKATVMKYFATHITVPSVATIEISETSANTATIRGDVTSDGGTEITERGVVYSTTQNPTIECNKVVRAGTNGKYSVVIKGLTKETTYYSRSYATNSEGTSYGDELTFTTTKEKSLYAWGLGTNGLLGLGNDDNKNTPQKVGNDNNWRTVSAGGAHSLAIKEDGTIWAWGYNIQGQLGLGNDDTYDTPHQIGIDYTWKAISAGNQHSLAIKEDGTLWSWGYNEYGQLGLGNLDSYNIPQQIGTDNDWKFISAGGNYSLAIKEDGSLWVFGSDPGENGILGLGLNNWQSLYPQQIGSSTNWKASFAGKNNHSLAIQEDGTIWSWGLGAYGRLGLGNDFNTFTPHQIGNSIYWKTIVNGYDQSYAISDNSKLWAWGYNMLGQLGLGNFDSEFNSPQELTHSTGWYFLASGGLGHNLAIKDDGSLWAWGYDYLQVGLLGLGNENSYNSPQQVGNKIDWALVSIGFYHNLALSYYTPTTVSSVTVPNNGRYLEDDNLDFTVNWSENVTITGTPRLVLTIGSSTKYANYVSGSGNNAILFRYTVVNGDLDSDGIVIGSLELNNGTIKDASTNDAILALNLVGITSGVLVGGTAPEVETDDATNITINSSTINGEVISDGYLELTARGFVISSSETTPTLANSTVHTDANSTEGMITKDLTSLSSLTTFYYRAYATNSIGTSYGAVKTFSTLATEPTNQSKSITYHSVTKNRIGLRWTKGDGSNRIVIASTNSLNGSSYLEDGVEYTAGDYGVNQIGTSGVFVVYNGNNTTCLVEGLARNTTYNFRIMEYNGSGNTSNYLQSTASGNPSSRKTSAKESDEINTISLNVYPNPVSNLLNIELNTQITNGKLTIINEVGQEVYSTDNLKNNLNINTTNYAKGVYHILITGEDETMYHSFVIER